MKSTKKLYVKVWGVAPIGGGCSLNTATAHQLWPYGHSEHEAIAAAAAIGVDLKEEIKRVYDVNPYFGRPAVYRITRQGLVQSASKTRNVNNLKAQYRAHMHGAL